MGSKETGKILRWIKDTSTDPHWKSRFCRDCGWFSFEYPKYVCLKFDRTRSENEHACEYFQIKTRKLNKKTILTCRDCLFFIPNICKRKLIEAKKIV